MKPLVRAALALSLCATAHAGVVRPAPNFAIQGIARGTTLQTYRGQTVVLLITRNARQKKFREMVLRLKRLYGQFSTERALFVAAIENGPQEVHSDIPFLLAADPPQIAADYSVPGPFAIAVIGVDGNLDLITTRLVAPERIRDALFDNYETQAAARPSPTPTQ